MTQWIILELTTGLRKSDSKQGLLRWFEPVHRLAGPGDSNWDQVWEHASILRRRGVSVTAADCLIASIAVQHDVALVHCDGDFEAMKAVLPSKTVDWTPHIGR